MESQEATYTDLQRNLLRSVLEGDESQVSELLKESSLSPADIGEIFRHAVRLGTAESLEAARMLVEAGADIDGTSYLHFLVKSKNPRCHDLALLLIRHGADANAYDGWIGESVLDTAIREEAPVDVIEKLVQLGACVTSLSEQVSDHPHAVTILPWVIEGCSRRAAKALFFCVDGLLDSFARDKWLICAAAILDMGFPVRELEQHGVTLQFAVQTEDIERVRLFVDYGFSVNGSPTDETSPLVEALQLEHSAITELLLRAGAEINDALHDVCALGSEENIEVLLRLGVDVNLINSQGVTAFSLIDFNGIMSGAHRIFIRHLAALVSKGKDVNNGDLSIIENHPEMRLWYAHCTNELQIMRNFKVIKDISILSFFREKDIRQLLFATRNYEFEENVTSEFLIDLFPNYGNELALSLEEAKNRRKWFGERAEALYDSLNNILPDVPIDKIVHYLYMDNIVV